MSNFSIIQQKKVVIAAIFKSTVRSRNYPAFEQNAVYKCFFCYHFIIIF